MINLLAEGGGMPGWIIYVVFGVIIVLLVVWMIFSGKKRKKQEEDAQKLVDAVGPGNKVKTIGGICGIVVEVDKEENTFVLETGTESTGKCYIKFDKQAIYQTDAVVEDAKPVGEAAETPATEEAAETPVAEPAAETPADSAETAETATEKE